VVSALPSYRYTVDGLVLPIRVAGHPALDFCNTSAGRGEPGAVEYLESYEHLAAFAREAGLVEAQPQPSPSEAAAVLDTAKELREALYQLCVSGHDDGAWSTVAAHVQGAARAAVLAPGPPPRWTLPPETGAPLPLLAIAQSVGHLLLNVSLADVRRCPGKGCGWLFLDPRGRRRWCSMATCGNREKVRRHAARARRGRAADKPAGPIRRRSPER
jgi:predicted RNA-binding Zn ribbon-like protein